MTTWLLYLDFGDLIKSPIELQFGTKPILMSQTLPKLQTRLQSASAEYQKLQTDLSIAVDARQKLDAQLSENELVKKVVDGSVLFPGWI